MPRSLVAAAIAVATVLLTPALASADPTCATSGPKVCVALAHTPDSVSAAAPGFATYAQLRVVVSNESSSSVTHVTLADSLPAGSTLISAGTDTGTCASGEGSVACDLGRLASGASATVTISVEIAAGEGSVANAVAVSFDERANDGPTADPKQDTVLATDPIAVTAQSGRAQTWVPAGVAVDLTTDPAGAGVASPDQPFVATARVPARPEGRVAALASTAAPFACPPKSVCRAGDWMEASIPGTFSDVPLQFALRWDKTLVANRQNTKNLAVFYTECVDGCAVETITRRCSSGTPAAFEQPCLWAVKEEQDGDFSAVLIRDHNGYMR